MCRAFNDSTVGEMYKTYEYRLYPTRAQRGMFLACLVESRHLYNEMLDAVKDHHERAGKFLSRNELARRFKGRGGQHVPQTTVQTLADRLDKALARFLRRRTVNRKVGFPRFKSANRWHSIRLRQYGAGQDVFVNTQTQRLHVPKKLGSRIKVKQHRPLEGTPKTAHLVTRADGHWYVLIVCDLGNAPEKRDGPGIGLDVGLRHFVADSDGYVIENPRCFRKAQKKLRVSQRKITRRNKGSNRRRKAARHTARRHLKITRQRKDHAHKTARHYVSRYAFIAVEDLRIENMLKNRHLARAIADASWSAFRKILTLKAENAGARVVEVPPHFTSQRCFRCGELVRKPLSVRTHVCPHCRYVEDRDTQAAKNVLRKARAEPSERKVAGCGEPAPRSPLL